MEEVNLLKVGKKFWKKGLGIAINSRGSSGGAATFWDSTIYELEAEKRTMHWVFTKLIHKFTSRTVSLFNLYVPVSISEKKDCWEMLENYLSS